MKKFFVLCILALGFCQFAMSQQTALTADGKLVILYENGTWTYADVKMPEESNVTAPTQNTEAVNLPAIAENKVDNSPIVLKDGMVEKKAFIEGPSPKLSKYFKQKNIVRCDLILTSKDGKVMLESDWKIMNGEAYSYFGFIKQGAVLSLELVGGKKVDLTFNGEFEPKEYEKYGFSTYKAFLDLSKEQIRDLRNGIILKATMNWSRRSEEYKVVAPAYFIHSLPNIIE